MVFQRFPNKSSPRFIIIPIIFLNVHQPVLTRFLLVFMAVETTNLVFVKASKRSA